MVKELLSAADNYLADLKFSVLTYPEGSLTRSQKPYIGSYNETIQSNSHPNNPF